MSIKSLITLITIGIFFYMDQGGAVSLPQVYKRDLFEFKYSVILPEIRGDARLWIPVAQENRFQSLKTFTVSGVTGGKFSKDKDYGNLTIMFQLKQEHSHQEIEIKYEVHRKEKGPYNATEKELKLGMNVQALVPRNKVFKQIAEGVIGDRKEVLDRGKALYTHVLHRMCYSKNGEGWGRGDAVYACNAREGNCTDFHSYFIALARAIGIPARFAIGFTIPDDQAEGIIDGYHCWAEFSADERWIPVDISEAWKNPKLEEYYCSHHPANRFEFSVGRDIQVDPIPESGPVNFLIYPIFEVNGKTKEIKTRFSFKRLNKRFS